MKYLKYFLLAMTIAAVSLLTVPVNAQDIEAVHLPDRSFYYASSIIPQQTSSPIGLIAIDYLCTSVPVNKGKTLIVSYASEQRKVVLDFGIDNVSNAAPDVSVGNHFYFSTNGGPANPDQVMTFLSDTIAPCDGAWNQVVITWNSGLWFPGRGRNGQYDITGYVAGANTPVTALTWNGLFSGGGLNPTQFSTPYRYNTDNSWSVGARYLGFPVPTAVDFWKDDLARVYVTVNAADYLAMQNQRKIQGFGATSPDGKWRPVRWGLHCNGPMQEYPTICMVGGLGQSGFRFNDGQTFAVPSGYAAPTAAQDDIWVGYP